MEQKNAIGSQDFWAATVALLGAIQYQSWDKIDCIEKLSPNKSTCVFCSRGDKNQKLKEVVNGASRRYWADTFEKYLQINLPSFRENGVPTLSEEETKFCNALAAKYLLFIEQCAFHISAHNTLTGSEMEKLFNDMGLTLD